MNILKMTKLPKAFVWILTVFVCVFMLSGTTIATLCSKTSVKAAAKDKTNALSQSSLKFSDDDNDTVYEEEDLDEYTDEDSDSDDSDDEEEDTEEKLEEIVECTTSIANVVKISKKKIAVELDEIDVADGYMVYISTSKKFKKNVKVYDTEDETPLATITAKFKKGKYFIKARAYTYDDDGEEVFAKYSSVKTIKFKK